MRNLEFNGLEEFATFLGYDFPEEIYEVAHYEGFWHQDWRGADSLSRDGINDFLNRLTHGEVICTGIFRETDPRHCILLVEKRI